MMEVLDLRSQETKDWDRIEAAAIQRLQAKRPNIDYFGFQPGGIAVLDGEFTIDDLEAVIEEMRVLSKEAQG
ncbi:MAG: hypothetical protein ABFD92_21200 [Planctomycetaceae bacterium]